MDAKTMADAERNSKVGKKEIRNISNAPAEEKLCRVPWQVFVALVINMQSNGGSAAMTGLIIARLKETETPVKMSSDEESWFASLFLIGCAVGSLLCGIKSRYLGRKKTVMITQAVALLGALCIILAKNLALFYAGNFFCGYANGMFLCVAPIYTGEINQPKIRKFTGSFSSLTFSLGFSLTYLVGSLTAWKIAAYIQAVWPCIVLIFLFLCPESPTWLIAKGRKDLAIDTLIKLRGNKEIAMNEIVRIEHNLEKQKLATAESHRSTYIRYLLNTLSKGTFVRPCLVLTILMAICWQWTGGQVLRFYTVDLLNKFELPIDPYSASSAIGCYQLLGGLFGIPISALIPRRKYYIASGSCIFVGTFLLATIVHLKRYAFFVDIFNDNMAMRWIPVIAYLIYFAGYSTGYVAVGFMLLGELLPSNAREMGSFIVVQSNSISSIVMIKFAPNLETALGLDGMFWLFSSVALFSIIFAYCCVPETSGKTLEEIEEHYRVLCSPNHTRNKNLVVENMKLPEITGIRAKDTETRTAYDEIYF